MATKPVRVAIKNMLANLGGEEFKNFCYELRSRKEEPLVSRNKVDGKSYLEITHLLVSAFTEAGAPLEAERILREIHCNQEADDLVKETGGQTSTPGSSNTGGSSSGAAGPIFPEQVTDFLHKHRRDLIQGVTKPNVNQILDLLLEKGHIDEECNGVICSISTSQDQMREIFKVINSQKARDTLYKILEEKERDLMDELKNKI